MGERAFEKISGVIQYIYMYSSITTSSYFFLTVFSLLRPMIQCEYYRSIIRIENGNSHPQQLGTPRAHHSSTSSVGGRTPQWWSSVACIACNWLDSGINLQVCVDYLWHRAIWCGKSIWFRRLNTAIRFPSSENICCKFFFPVNWIWRKLLETECWNVYEFLVDDSKNDTTLSNKYAGNFVSPVLMCFI